MISKLRHLIHRHTAPPRTRESFYNLSATCQIPNLDLIYEQYFGRTTDGVFIEVGAFDGEYVSNTSGLADLGWHGVYVEPVPAYYEKCRSRHARNGNVQVVNTAIGHEAGEVTLHVGGALTTAEPAMKENFVRLDWAKGSFPSDETCTVPMIPLDTLLQQKEVEAGFQLLVVDVEGFEWNVLRSFPIHRWRPQMVIIELHDQNDDYLHIREDCIQIVDYFQRAGYKVIWKDFSNTIYVPDGSFPLAPSDR